MAIAIEIAIINNNDDDDEERKKSNREKAAAAPRMHRFQQQNRLGTLCNTDIHMCA